jgi:hypothetical protein
MNECKKPISLALREIGFFPLKYKEFIIHSSIDTTKKGIPNFVNSPKWDTLLIIIQRAGENKMFNVLLLTFSYSKSAYFK